MVAAGTRVGINADGYHPVLANALPAAGSFHCHALAAPRNSSEMGTHPPATLVDASDGRCRDGKRLGHIAY
jgi:hypothetical protein